MKGILSYILLVFVLVEAYCQEGSFLSSEFRAEYYHYSIGNNYQNKFNYGLYILVSLNTERIKMSTGFGYSTKSYLQESHTNPYSSYQSINRIDYNLKYLRIPLTTEIRLFSFSRNYVCSILTGFVFNQIVGYDIARYNERSENYTEKGLINNRELGISLLLGATISNFILYNWKVNISPFLNYSLIADHNNQRPNYRNIPEDKLTVGLGIGVEYLFNK